MEPQHNDTDLIRALPTLARLAAAAWLRTAEWTVGATFRTSSRVLRAAMSGESPAEVFQEGGAEVREYLRQLLGMDLNGAGPTAEERPEEATDSASLREQGAELLRRSADVDLEQEHHPAYGRILQELAPDEGRILRLLALEGAQPAVDVRTGGPLGVIKSDLVAPGLNMIGLEAGCRHPEHVRPYLNNLHRLGLVWFSREPLDDVQRYHVLEAQPEVAQAIEEAGSGKTVRRSIHFTPFGEDFCQTCLPLETAELEALSDSEAPPGAADRS
jgi:abortive infection alpha-like protein